MNKTTKITVISAVAIAIVAGGTIAGINIANNSTDAPAPVATATPVATPAPDAEPTEAPAETPAKVWAVGDITETVGDTAEAEAAGFKVFPLKKGSVVYDPNAPLPAAVTDAITAPVKEVLGDPDSDKIRSAARDAAQSASSKTGRNVAVIISALLSADGENYETYYVAYEGGENTRGLARASRALSLDECIAKAQAWIAEQPDAVTWELVVAG